MTDLLNISKIENICLLPEDLDKQEDPRTPTLRRVSYGIVLPTICCLGIIGNILNLIVLTRRNMRGTAYVYMRGYSAAALLAILFCIPFALRVLIHKETGGWSSWIQAFYHAHFELFLGNGCLGVGVMMLLALTVERYVSVCHPGQHTRPLCGPPHLTVVLIPLATFLVYLPSVFRGEITTCLLAPDGPLIYQKRDNQTFLNSWYYQVYKVVLEVVYKVAPTILLAGFNLRIMIVYRRSCERRRRMTLSRTVSSDEDPRTFAEERRLMLLLGSTSILFLVCVSPMVILNVTLSESNLNNYAYQVFRALANLLEVINYSITFYIYCLFSEDFRNTLIRTLQWPWVKSEQGGRSLPMKRSPIPRPTTTTTTPPTTTVATPGHLARASV
ncbi:PREDICTED: probable G-protein coupled receptor B0563.6 [Atta cephalotes]|uniref:G-protein coupled receptors family 1 profile domain-containing protein n=1 Tax=Atta cephalotes TaxID=12957 RepID=A0A158NI28_ATTCE|nr:PREDICTED: probable G-protein coupled receptor B0563.6 [Atta cephalotes]XP_018046216.1 PREDICTED: probable G-protein coupled receptor B0563.6 [Atta colombica]